MSNASDIPRILTIRARIMQALREWFASNAFVEVETPVRVAAPANELHIDALPSGRRFLRTSPELQMKRLLAAGMPRIYQVGPCFRAGEEGALHDTEFTMLEWYRAGADYRDILADTQRLLARVVDAVTASDHFRWQTTDVCVSHPWHVMPVREAFLAYAGWDPLCDYDADRFDLDLVGKVEPALPRDRPVVLIDYPREAAALARCRAGAPPIAERWELYVAGVELANAYSELIDEGEQRARFAACRNDRRDLGKPAYPIDEPFMAALTTLPESGGIALGIDRLVMLLADVAHIRDVRPMMDCRER